MSPFDIKQSLTKAANELLTDKAGGTDKDFTQEVVRKGKYEDKVEGRTGAEGYETAGTENR